MEPMTDQPRNDEPQDDPIRPPATDSGPTSDAGEVQELAEGGGGPATSGGPDGGDVAATIPHAGLKYFTMRTLLLLAVGGVLYLLGLRGLLLAVLAFLISGAISLFALSRSRIAAARNLDHSISRVSRRIEDRAAAEDIE